MVTPIPTNQLPGDVAGVSNTESQNQSPKRSGNIWILILGLLFVVTVWLIWLFYGMHWARSGMFMLEGAAAVPSSSDSLAQLGQAGDAFGSLNALFAAIAGAVVLWAGYVQLQTLNHARESYHSERTAREQQQLEATLFQMLTLTRQLTHSIRPRRIGSGAATGKSERRRGAAALDSLAASLNNYIVKYHSLDDESCGNTLALVYDEFVYKKQPSTLGPYFRLLYQIFKLIDESSLKCEIQTRYANIVRGQLSDGMVFLLAANGMTKRGARFVPYIQKFGLLEHMHTEYKETFKSALQQAYRKGAFIGSKERAYERDLDKPLNAPWHFDSDLALRASVLSIHREVMGNEPVHVD